MTWDIRVYSKNWKIYFESIKSVYTWNSELLNELHNNYLVNNSNWIVNQLQAASITEFESHNSFLTWLTWISQLSNLEVLNITWTNVHELPIEIWRLSNLKEIYAKWVPISKIPATMELLTNLEVIDFRDTQLPRWIRKLITNSTSWTYIWDLKNWQTIKITSNWNWVDPLNIEVISNWVTNNNWLDISRRNWAIWQIIWNSRISKLYRDNWLNNRNSCITPFDFISANRDNSALVYYDNRWKKIYISKWNKKVQSIFWDLFNNSTLSWSFKIKEKQFN